MRIDFEYLEDLYDDEEDFVPIRKTKILDDPGELVGKKKKKNYNKIRAIKYEGYNDNL